MAASALTCPTAIPCDSHKLWEASLHAQAVPSPTDLRPALPTLVPAAPNTEPVTGEAHVPQQASLLLACLCSQGPAWVKDHALILADKDWDNQTPSLSDSGLRYTRMHTLLHTHTHHTHAHTLIYSHMHTHTLTHSYTRHLGIEKSWSF